MRFAFTDDQLAFAAAARDLFAAESAPAQVRSVWESGTGRVPGLWRRLVDMGVVGMCASEASGGLGLGFVDLVGVLHEAGRAAVPDPVSAVAAVAVPACVEAGRDDLVASLVAGDVTVALGLRPDELVAGADAADLLLLERDGRLHLVARAEVEVEPVETVDHARPVGRVTFAPGADSALDASADVARDRAAVAVAAELCGLADTMVEMTVAYVGERRQFGVPIGSFQAVKHRLADALTAVEFAKPLVWRAAIALDGADDADHVDHARAGLHASAAKAAASAAALTVAGHALQCHGAIGYTVEHDLHLFMKRAWALAAAHGDARWHRRRIAGMLGIGVR